MEGACLSVSWSGVTVTIRGSSLSPSTMRHSASCELSICTSASSHASDTTLDAPVQSYPLIMTFEIPYNSFQMVPTVTPDDTLPRGQWEGKGKQIPNIFISTDKDVGESGGKPSQKTAINLRKTSRFTHYSVFIGNLWPGREF